LYGKPAIFYGTSIIFYGRCMSLMGHRRHFKSSRRELTNVRIKRLTNVKHHNEVLKVYISLE
jgi:hypothetical protein